MILAARHSTAGSGQRPAAGGSARSHRFVAFLLVFAFLYTPFVRLAGTTIHLPYIVTGGFVISFLWIWAREGVKLQYFTFITLFLAPYCWILLVSVVTGRLDPGIHLAFSSGVASILAAYAIVKWISKADVRRGIDVVITSVFLAGVAHAAIMVIAFFVPAFSSLLYSVVVLGEKGNVFVERMIRSPGLSTGGGDSLSVIQAAALVCGLVDFATFRRRSLAKQGLYVVGFVLLLISILLSARTGFVVLLVGIGILIVRAIASALITLSIRRTVVAKAALAMIVLAMAGPVLYSALASSEYFALMNRAFEPVQNYLTTGRLSTSSTDRLIDTMIIVPSSERVRVLGSGDFATAHTSPGVHSDIGYIRTIFGAGIVGTVLIYSVLLYPLLLAWGKRREAPNLALLIVFFVVTILVVNLKVFHFGGVRESFRVLCMLTAAILIHPSSDMTMQVRGRAEVALASQVVEP